MSRVKITCPEAESLIYPARDDESKRLHANALDELDTLNHHAFRGKHDFVRRSLLLTVNGHGNGDETIFLAAQLAGTDSIVVHHDRSETALEHVRRRAERTGVLHQIRFVGGPLEALRNALQGNPAFRASGGFGPFDYIRCTGGLEEHADFEAALALLAELLKENGTIGMSCFGYYGREPYRQMQQIDGYLNSDRPGLEIGRSRLKELFPFMPSTNWTRMAFDQLEPEVRSAGDEAYAAHFMKRDRHGLKVPELYGMLDRHGLHHAGYSRQTRMLYQPWFAAQDEELDAVLRELSPRDRQAVSEIACGCLSRHHFWASRLERPRVDSSDLDNIPFFNPWVRAKRNWKSSLGRVGPDAAPELILEPAPGMRLNLPLPWGHVEHRLVELVDGFKTLGEIVVLIREESDETLGVLEIAQRCIAFIDAVQDEDIVLLRHRSVPVLPFTARRLTDR